MKEVSSHAQGLFIKFILLILLGYSVMLLVTILAPFTVFIAQSVVFGILMWFFVGLIAPYLIYGISLAQPNIIKSNLYLLKGKREYPQHPHHMLLASLEASLNPTLLAFGILNLALNYFNFVFELGLFIIVFILVFGLGIVVPIISITRDSDLIILKPEERLIQPVGARLQSYLRGISGFTALLGLSYTLLMVSADIFLTIDILMSVLALTYPPIFVISFVYYSIHYSFVERLNQLLSKKFKKCKVIVERDTKEDASFIINY